MKIEITSLKNPKVKNFLDLQKPKSRRKTGLFTIEGIREISLAQQGGYLIKDLFIRESLYAEDRQYPIDMSTANLYQVTQEIFSKIAYRDSSGGIVATATMKNHQLDDLKLDKNPLLVILESVEKPGNIGAMLRTADAGNISGLIICDSACDIYNPNVVRSSLGCLFTVPVAACSNEELLAFLKKNNIQSFATLLSASYKYTSASYLGPTAFVLGAESDGLSPFWQQNADVKIKIPMAGKIDSLNVSNAAAIFMFEALRQRNL